jgi:uncharacterized protein YecT (DUF1311 family)
MQPTSLLVSTGAPPTRQQESRIFVTARKRAGMHVMCYLLWSATLVSAVAEALEPSSPLKECYATAANRIEVSRCLERQRDDANAGMARCVQAVRKQMQQLDAVRNLRLAVTSFDEAQKAFEAFRERNCRWVAARMEPGTGAGDAALDCMIRMTRARTAELAADEADCRSAAEERGYLDGK